MTLDISREALVGLSAAVGSRGTKEMLRSLNLAAVVADANAVDEVLLQAHLFVGFPTVLEALALWREIKPDHRRVARDETWTEWVERGEAVCRTIYGDNYDKLRVNVSELHPDLDLWMVAAGYGRVIGRPGLDLATRELCNVALLAVWDAPRQLHSHLRGALNAGATHQEVSDAIDVAGRLLDARRVAELNELWVRVAPAGDPTEGPGTRAVLATHR